MSRLLDKKIKGQFPFKYKNAASTDISITWQEARKKMEKAPVRKVVPFSPAKGK